MQSFANLKVWHGVAVEERRCHATVPRRRWFKTTQPITAEETTTQSQNPLIPESWFRQNTEIKNR